MNILVPHGFESNYTLGFVKGLLANGVDICVISSDMDELKLLDSGIQSINLRGSQDHNRSFKTKASTLLKYYALLMIFLFKHSGSIVHFTGIFRNFLILFDGILINLCFKLLSSRYVYTVHNVLPHNKENSQFFKLIYRLIYKIPDKLLVHTRLAKEQLIKQFYVPAQKIIVISIGINEEVPISEISREESKKLLSFELEDRIILFFGKADEYKGLDILIEAFDRLLVPKAKLLIAAWFPNLSYRNKIISAIDASPFSRDIYLHEGFLPNNKVELFFKSADVLSLPYRNIYQSGVVFLCFIFGLPVVATDVGSFQELVKDGLGLVTETNDADGVAEKLRLFFKIQHYFQREAIVESAKKYRWGRICKSIVNLYQ